MQMETKQQTLTLRLKVSECNIVSRGYPDGATLGQVAQDISVISGRTVVGLRFDSQTTFDLSNDTTLAQKTLWQCYIKQPCDVEPVYRDSSKETLPPASFSVVSYTKQGELGVIFVKTGIVLTATDSTATILFSNETRQVPLDYCTSFTCSIKVSTESMSCCTRVSCD